jgi:hypothetical protein
LLVIAGLSGAASAAPTAPRTINDCEKIQAADAYNQCLASFGPAAHEHRLSPVAPGMQTSPHAARQGGRRAVSRAAVQQRPSGGRQRMEFTIYPRHGRS